MNPGPWASYISTLLLAISPVKKDFLLVVAVVVMVPAGEMVWLESWSGN